MRTLSSELQNHIGKTVHLAGWLHKKRAMGGLMFVVLRDRKGLTQVVIQNEQEQQKLHGLQIGTVLSISGTVMAEPRAAGGVEIHNPSISVLVPVEEPPPIEIDKPIDHKPENLDTLFEHRVVSLRNPTETGIFKIQSAVGDAVRDYLKSQDFTEFHSPKLLAEATEGGAEVFKLDYFGREATLAQSAQFYKQMMVGVFERAFEFGATYRAEPSMTTRHMSEYITIDAEMGFISDLSDIQDLLSGLLNVVCDQVWKHHKAELVALKAEPPILTQTLPSITLRDLHAQYSAATGTDTTKEKDPTPAEERWVSDYSLAKHKSEAIFVTEFPASEMKFYHHRNEHNPDISDRADLIFRGVEIVTLTQREHRYPILIEQLKAIGADPAHPGFEYYLQAFKYGLPPHGGFGLGLERLTQKLIGLSNVKEATLFPRDMQRLAP
ncbi:MAG: aspartate--tRNA(Asn) ligase [Candidatus Saccharimonadia bacterium]